MLKVNTSFRFPKPDQKDRKTHIVSIAAMVMGMQAVSNCGEMVLIPVMIVIAAAMFACLKLGFKELRDTETNCDCMLSFYVMKYFVGVCIQSVLTLLVLLAINMAG